MRTLRGVLACSIVLLTLSALVFAASPVRIVVNSVDLGPAAQGRVIDGQVMVPIRAVAEALGAEVRWEPGESCVYITTQTAEASEEPAPAPAEKKGIIVYITKTGSKYHRAGCRYLSKSSIPISLEDAKARGYGPCSACRAVGQAMTTVATNR